VGQFRGLIVAACAAFTTSAMAQPPQGKSADIVVTARKPVDRKEARAFVNKISAPVAGQFARFRAPVCPKVYGMPADYAARIEQRMRDTAAAAKIPVAGDKCGVNVMLVFAENGAAFVKDALSHNPSLLDGVTAGARTQLKGEAPVRAWTATHETNDDGQSVSPAQFGPGGAPIMFTRTASIIVLPTLQVIDTAVIVIEQTAAVGKTLTQLSDYAAMRAYARTRDQDADASDSILTLFDADAERLPQAMTSLDAAYLSGLYKGQGNRHSYDQAAIMARGISKRTHPDEETKDR
jgi:hypothetical protein